MMHEYWKEGNGKRRPLIKVLFITAAITAMGAVTMLLWNWLMPVLFGTPAISFVQALGLILLSRIILGHSRRSHGYWRQGHWSSHWGGDHHPEQSDEETSPTQA